jgi:hypothetical protein
LWVLKKGQDQKGARMLLVEWTNEKWPASYIFNHQDTRPPAAYKRWKQSKSSSTEGQSGWRLTLPPSGTHIPLGRSPHWADEAVQELVRKLSNKALGLDSRAAEEQEELVSRLFGAVKEQTHPLNFVPPPKVRTQVATLGLTWIEGAALVRLDPHWLKRAHWNAGATFQWAFTQLADLLQFFAANPLVLAPVVMQMKERTAGEAIMTLVTVTEAQPFR